EALAEHGCRPADDLAAVAAEAGVVWVLVPDAAAARDVLDGQDGLAARLPEGSLVVLNSTVGPDQARELADLCAGQGIDLVEAPVSGGADAARDGELLLLLGGTAEAVERAREVVAPVAREVVATGASGTASVVKLANQHVLFAGLTALYEAAGLAAAAGVGEDVLLSALRAGTARSWAVETWGFYDRLSRDYDDRDVPDGHRPWVKDVAEVREVAAGLDVAVPTAAVVADHLATAIRRHAEDEDPARTGDDDNPTGGHR
ncbi:NAD(P)-binding domain-containing protein, partial [Desertihabitans aurantiacus]|uniref:NAD(P)-binding domain-containing protein n=1 Tax=Desertihabitans aurantiacus TaxID=2282477 RepID=UPI0013007629